MNGWMEELKMIERMNRHNPAVDQVEKDTEIWLVVCIQVFNDGWDFRMKSWELEQAVLQTNK